MFCPDCGTWNRSSAVICARCSHELPEVSDAPSEKPDEEMDLLRRAAGGRYRIFRRLATGGMASVYAAKHVQLGRQLVVKVLLGHLARDPEMRERFKREAEASAQLFHPHICSILDYGELETTVYLVMPYMAGGSLADLIVRGGTVPPAVAASVCAQVSIALDYAHRHGIVHRDIKPDNILFDEDGNALITDFGIATARFHQRLTMTGRAMGTPHYMSPEQAMGKMVDGRSDIYAVGVVMYETLVGFPPFDGADSYSIGYKHVHEDAAVAGHRRLAHAAGARGDHDEVSREGAGGPLPARERSVRCADRLSFADRRRRRAAKCVALAPARDHTNGEMKLTHEIVSLRTKHAFTIARGGGSEYRVNLVTITDEDGARAWARRIRADIYGENPDTVAVVLDQFAPVLEKADAWSLEAIEARDEPHVARQRLGEERREVRAARSRGQAARRSALQAVGARSRHRAAHELHDRRRARGGAAREGAGGRGVSDAQGQARHAER